MAVSLCGALSPVEGHSSSPKLYKAVENFMPSHDGELGLRQGDVVSSVKELGNGWSLGRNDNADSRVGIFPSRYVRPLPTFVAIPKVPLAVHRGDVSNERAKRTSGRRKIKEIDELNLNLSVCNDAEKVPDHENYLEHEPPAVTEQDRVKLKVTSPIAKRLHPHNKDLANSFSVTEPDSVISTPRRGKEFISGQKPHMVVKPNQDKLFDESFERIDDVPPTSQDDDRSNYQRLNSWRDQVEDQLFLPNLSQRLVNTGLSNGRSTSLLDLPARCDSLGTPLALLPSGAMPPSMTLMDLDVSQQQHYYSVDQSPTTAAAVATPMRRFGRPPPTETKRFCVDYRALTATTASSSAVDLSSSNSTAGVRHKAILKPRNQRVADSNAQHVYYADNTNGHNKSCRLVACVSTGLTIGVLVFFWMFYHMDYNYTVSAIFAVILTVLLCLLLSLSRMVRCVAALLLPSLCTARGRAAFTVFLFGFLLSGPVGNIYVNMAEISRSMSCSAEQSYRQTILLLEPFDAMMDQLNRTIVSLQDAAHNVSRGLEPLDHGLERVELDVYNGNVQLYGTRKVKARVEQNIT